MSRHLLIVKIQKKSRLIKKNKHLLLVKTMIKKVEAGNDHRLAKLVMQQTIYLFKASLQLAKKIPIYLTRVSAVLSAKRVDKTDLLTSKMLGQALRLRSL